MKTTTRTGSLILLSLLVLMAACASVPMAPPEQDAQSKTFAPPAPGKSGLYVARDSSFGSGLKKTVYVDGVAIGETARYVYLHREIEPGKHTLGTESEFGDNDLEFEAEAGTNHFFRQYIKFGLFVGGANLEILNEENGKTAVLACKEALGFVPEPEVSDEESRVEQ